MNFHFVANAVGVNDFSSGVRQHAVIPDSFQFKFAQIPRVYILEPNLARNQVFIVNKGALSI